MEYREENKLLLGRNAAVEALEAGLAVDQIWISRNARGLERLRAMADARGVVVKQVAPKKLDSFGTKHQGVVAFLAAAPYVDLEDILNVSKQKGTSPFLLLADGIEDPHNLGALIRTAEAAGMDGLIIPKRRSASLTPVVSKTSAGAVSCLRVARVANLTAVIERLKAQSIWVYGADMNGDCWCTASFTGGTALVVGAEGTGLSRLVRETCDQILSLPMLGQINSLNASVAGGILMYEMARQRNRIAANNP